MLFSRHAVMTNSSLSRKQRTALQFHFLCAKSLESVCTLLLLSAREQISGRSLARLAVRCHVNCGDDTVRHKSCYYRWRWWNAVPFQSLPRQARETKRVLFSSHAICYHHGDPSDTHSCCARGAELLLPNPPSPQCHHLALAARFRPATKHLAVTTYIVDRWTITIHES